MRPETALLNKNVVITGASGGIGRIIAEKLAHKGAKLILVARRADVLSEVSDSLPGGPHARCAIDSSREELWPAVVDALGSGTPVDGLVTAAGVLGPIGPVGSWDISEFRRTVEVNLLGTIVPIVSLLDRLVKAHGSIVTFSGGGATTPLRRFDAYAASKAAVVRLTENMAADLLESGVRINAIAPGFVVTDIHQATLAAGPERVGTEYFERTAGAVATGDGDSPDDAAELTAFLISDAAHGITGRLISARWDPWRDADFQSQLRVDSDLGTLRRIDNQFFTKVPE